MVILENKSTHFNTLHARSVLSESSILQHLLPCHTLSHIVKLNITCMLGAVLDLLGVGGLTSSGVSQCPKFSLTPTILVKNSQKYIAGFTTNQVLVRWKKNFISKYENTNLSSKPQMFLLIRNTLAAISKLHLSYIEVTLYYV